MGRVSLLVEANTSDAISKISGLGEAIKKAMSGFDSSKLATWEQSFDKQLQSVKGKLNDLKEKLKGLTNDFKAEVPFGANNSISTFKDRLKSADEALKTFKATFKDGYTFGAVAQIDSLKSKLNEAQKAIAALNAEAGKSTNLGANQNAKAKKDEITKTIAAVEQLNRSLAKKPVIGAVEAVRSLEQALQKLSANVPNYLSPISFSLNALKTQMLELSQVLNSVQQPTWVEPFKTKMQEVVKVLQDIATAYKSVKGELKQSVGESPIRREFKLSSSQAEQLLRTTTAFYSRIKKEFRETRAAATETARAIREAMAAINGGGTGAGGTGTATAGNRLGFGEQLFSRMRSNLYSYLTMWFGVAGAIRAANAVLEEHNKYLEKGSEFNRSNYNALGELYFKAGDKGDEYKAAAERMARQGFPSQEAAYQFASSAAMSGISVEEMESIAPMFAANVASGSDQRALMAGISYIRRAYGGKYSAKQIAAMIMEANRNNPSAVSPTAGAIQDLIKTYSGLGIELPDLIAMFTVGSETNKDARVKTMLRAVGNAVETKGLQAMAIGDVMAGNGVAGYEYYKDARTGAYKFKDEELQRQLESGDLKLTMEILTQWFAGKGREVLKDTGFNARTWWGAKELAGIGTNPEEYNRILANLEKIAGGDTSSIDSVVAKTMGNNAVKTEMNTKAVAALTGQIASNEAAIKENTINIRQIYKNRNIYNPVQWVRNFGDYVRQDAATIGGRLQEAGNYLTWIKSGDDFTLEEKGLAEESYVAALISAAKQYAVENGLNPENVKDLYTAFQKTYHYAGSGFALGSVEENKQYADALYVEAMRRAGVTQTALKEAGTTSKPTAAAGAIKAAAAGIKYVNQDEAEQIKAKEESEAEKKRRAAEQEAKRKEQQEASYAKAALDALPKWSIRTKENEFIKTAYSDVSSDMSADLQALKPYALGSEIGAKSDSNKVLSKAFYAYASDMTDAATDKEIVKQMVGAMLAAGMNKEGIGNLVNAYWEEMRLNNAANIRSEDNRNAINNFQQAVLELLSSLNDEAKKGNEPPLNPAASRPAPAAATR